MDLLLESSEEEDVDELILPETGRTRGRDERPLSREDLASLESFCSHPQVQNYRRTSRGRRNAIYIPVNRLEHLSPERAGIEEGYRRRSIGGS